MPIFVKFLNKLITYLELLIAPTYAKVRSGQVWIGKLGEKAVKDII